MTIDEAKTVFLNRGYVEVEGGIIYDADKWRESCVVISEWLEQESCEDAISREDVINLKWQGEASEEFLEGYASAIEDARVLPSVKPQQTWISVSERLPEFGAKVLCQCRAGIYEVLEYRSYGWYHDDLHCYMEGFVIAWMPLPEPWKGEKA